MQTPDRPRWPEPFVDLQTLIPDLQLELSYAGSDNFIGRPVDGYLCARALLTRPAAQQLAGIQARLRPLGLTLKLFDAYRPERAVREFIRWSLDPDDIRHKARFYPQLDKAQLFAEGYLVEHSSHSRGSTVDLTIAIAGVHHQAPGPLRDNGELDMGTEFDWFGQASHTDYPDLPAPIRANRQWLKQLMLEHDFVNLPQEWWHYTLRHEPFPEQAFDFPIT
ncbi:MULTISPECIES: M15 family metallopeptidase [unclassified Paludibacterium]|uniref:M15 family metallopeptidase n=1 Tax=unclassified Paludibacterium TaxID=2618429 RepID=UPI001C0572B3|nr:M15 family metallopeptidase [Paludibacterium sp. B53371]BEV71161.1 M15 family metallopeptidase [Paludibacterium sp. THUN1379]